MVKPVRSQNIDKITIIIRNMSLHPGPNHSSIVKTKYKNQVFAWHCVRLATLSIQTGLCTKLEGPVPTVCGDWHHCEGICLVQREGREDCQSGWWGQEGEGEGPRTP